jgi:FdhE protein
MSPWTPRIERATELTQAFPAACELLRFYCRISRFQESIFEGLRQAGHPDLNYVAQRLPELCALMPVGGAADEILVKGVESWEAMLWNRWQDPGAINTDGTGEFLARALLQPYAEYMASRGNAPREGEGACPFCSAKPLVSVLRPEGDGAKRSLICSLCATEWSYRRIVCPACGETDTDKLSIYKAEEIGYVRVDACDSCRRYYKSVDMTVNGLAVPVVDELATVALDVWAEESGYVKIQANLLGL